MIKGLLPLLKDWCPLETAGVGNPVEWENSVLQVILKGINVYEILLNRLMNSYWFSLPCLGLTRPNTYMSCPTLSMQFITPEVRSCWGQCLQNFGFYLHAGYTVIFILLYSYFYHNPLVGARKSSSGNSLKFWGELYTWKRVKMKM